MFCFIATGPGQKIRGPSARMLYDSGHIDNCARNYQNKSQKLLPCTQKILVQET